MQVNKNASADWVRLEWQWSRGGSFQIWLGINELLYGSLLPEFSGLRPAASLRVCQGGVSKFGNCHSSKLTPHQCSMFGKFTKKNFLQFQSLTNCSSLYLSCTSVVSIICQLEQLFDGLRCISLYRI